MRVNNAVIMAAGTSSRFAPLSYERHKAMTVVKGEVMIERQIEQLKEAGVPEIYVVIGYKAEQFEYLVRKYGVKLIYNPDYLTRNNNGSIWAARDVLCNSYICSSDNYFSSNPFEHLVEDSYYAAQYADGHTAEWCMSESDDGYIGSVSVGGKNAWYMLGHAFWSDAFSTRFLSILKEEYSLPETADKFWESIFMEHLNTLKMKIRKYAPGMIYEFDSVDELRVFDTSYMRDTRSQILKTVAGELGIEEQDIIHLHALKRTETETVGFEFDCPIGHYSYLYDTRELRKEII